MKTLLSLPQVDINCVRYIRKGATKPQNGDSKGDKPEGEDTDSDIESIVARESMVYIAAHYDAPLSLSFLLERNADPNMEGGIYFTALQAACQFGRQTIVEQLLDSGAKADIYGGNMGSAIIAACQGLTDVAILKKLLDAGCDVKYVGGEGFYALYTAIKQQKYDFVEFLVQNGSDVNIRDCGPQDNMLQCACEVGNEAIVQLLLGHSADYTVHGGTFDNALQAACYSGKPGVVKLLLNAGMSPDTKGDDYVYPLFRAVHEKQAGIVQALLDGGANPNVIGAGEGYCKESRHFVSILYFPQPFRREWDVYLLLRSL